MTERKQIVVGVDGSKGSLKALAWAGEMALRTQMDLVVLLAWVPPLPPLTGMGTSYTTRDSSDPAALAEEKLLESIATVLGPEPSVLVHPVVRQDRPAKALIKASANAEMLVVGRRGYGGFKGMLLGSVSQQVSEHARCTVVVVR